MSGNPHSALNDGFGEGFRMPVSRAAIVALLTGGRGSAASARRECCAG
jgi:hypothetical protein